MSLLVDQSGRSDGHDFAAGALERTTPPLAGARWRIAGAFLKLAALAVIGWALVQAWPR